MPTTALDIRTALEHAEIRKIMAYKGFYFQKAREVFRAFQQFEAANLAETCEALLDELAQSSGDTRDWLQQHSRSSSAYKLLLLIDKLIAYIDERLATTLNGNAYEDRRTLAKSNIRYSLWLKHLLRYKQFGHQLSAITSPNIRHAIKYLDHPQQGMCLISESARSLIAQNILQRIYEPDKFVSHLKEHFSIYDIPLQNEENRTLLLSRILNLPEIKEIWQTKKISDDAEPQQARSIIEHIHSYISGEGFFYSKQEVANFYLSLKTKPFVILAGISGTGKTQLALQFAAAIGAKGRCLLIPVRPDWTDNSDLIGYTDLHGNFRARSLLTFILKAHQEPELSFFVILDEMNLARVEHYFSDFLSLIETRERQGKRIITAPILPELEAKGKAQSKLREVYIPDNIYFIGTVNMDETTHPFSRKVLDRANAIEMNEVYLDWISQAEEIAPLTKVHNDFLQAPFLYAKDLRDSDKEKLKSCMLLLMHINRILKRADLHFGYRVRDEIAFYLLNRYEIREAISENEAMDFQIMQKILPRIYGSSRRIGTVIIELLRFLARCPELKVEMYADEIVSVLDKNKHRFYPKSVQKLLFMYRRLEEDGFTSFWI